MLKKQKKFQTSHLKELKKEEKRMPKVSKRKKIIKIWMEINKIETNKIIDKINETDVEKINEIYKIRLTKKKKRRLK